MYELKKKVTYILTFFVPLLLHHVVINGELSAYQGPSFAEKFRQPRIWMIQDILQQFWKKDGTLPNAINPAAIVQQKKVGIKTSASIIGTSGSAAAASAGIFYFSFFFLLPTCFFPSLFLLFLSTCFFHSTCFLLEAHQHK